MVLLIVFIVGSQLIREEKQNRITNRYLQNAKQVFNVVIAVLQQQDPVITEVLMTIQRISRDCDDS